MQNKELRISEAGEKLVGQRYKVLDKGYVGLVSYHGTDALVEAAARCSYQKGTRTLNDRRGLLRFLIKMAHSSPVEQASLTFEFKMPLFVIQQLLRHRVAKLNQESFRYSEVRDDVCTTLPEEWRLQSTTNKQGSVNGKIEYPDTMDGIDKITQNYIQDGINDEHPASLWLSNQEKYHQKITRDLYQTRLKFGIAKEQARKDISVSTFSSMYWQMDVRNLLHFMSLRCDSHAQLEIRLYANLVAGFVQKLFPLIFEAWQDYSFHSKTFSRMDLSLLNFDFQLQKEQVSSTNRIEKIAEKAKELGLSKREIDEYFVKIQPQEIQDFSLEQYEIYNPSEQSQQD